MPRSRFLRLRRCEGCECGVRHNQEVEFYESEKSQSKICCKDAEGREAEGRGREHLDLMLPREEWEVFAFSRCGRIEMPD